MKTLQFITYCSIALMAFAASCTPFDPDENTPPKQTEGWAPVYAQSATVIKSAVPRNIENGGKIYIKSGMLYQVESGKGVHILNITDPKNPQKVSFIEIPGCQEISIMGNIMYANNVNDLVSLDISDLNNIVEKDRKKDAFHILNKNHPASRGWFECIDPSKGEVIGWELKTLYSPKCLY
jgi:hypothetical protein